jgi:hypothetical protein
MIGRAFQLIDASNIYLRLGADHSYGVGGHFARRHLRLKHCKLDL